MPLVSTVLEAGIKTALDAQSDVDVDPAVARAKLAKDLATVITTYIKSGLVTVTVATTGSATNQAGGGTGSIT